jgi:hypothetical protein
MATKMTKKLVIVKCLYHFTSPSLLSVTISRQASTKSLAEVFSQISISSLLWSLVVLSTSLGCLYALFYHTQEFRKVQFSN